jgi:Family of unknown function (DUF5709)
MSSSFSEDQLQPDETLDERGVDDVLDEGMSPPERPSRQVAHRATAREDAEGDTLEERMEQEEPDPSADVDHSPEGQKSELFEADENADVSDGFEVGDERSGRLVDAQDPDPDEREHTPVAEDVGIDAGAASAEEAAMHEVDEDLP